MEPLTSTIFISIIGKPLAKFLFKQAFGESVIVNMAEELLDTVAKVFGESKEKNNVAKQFEEMSQGITNNLWPLFKLESEVDYSQAVARELADTLNQFVNTRLLIDSNLDAKQLLAQLKAKHSKQFVSSEKYPLGKASLGTAGESLYQRALQALAPQLVAFAPHFEDFQTAAQGEQLQRLDNISTQLEFIINGPKIKARLYELRYLSAVHQCLDEMELFGAELESGRKRHPLLSVAFVSLNLKQEESNTNIDAQRLFDEKVKRGQRLLIIGDAGSGKSTLMRWLALKAARFLLELEKPVTQRFLDKEDEFQHHEQKGDWWHRRVPFLLRLREYPDGKLPTPNEFAPALEAALDAPPDGWVQSVLDDGRGVIIFDGIDEVPEANRDALQQGMEGYFRNYPSTAFLLTARPAATEDWDEWRTQWKIDEARINPMSNVEKELLVRRWHDAVRQELERQGRKDKMAAVSEKETALIEKLFNDPNLSRLASYPLLCAVICALHNWKGTEPLKGYWRLCDDLCRLLIDERDREAQIRLEKFPAPYAALDYEEKREIAQTIAMAMAEPSFQSSLPLETAINLTKPILTDIPGRKASEASVVVRFMGERSGLLRVPREGDVEFIHNIFKEFLIADAFLKQGRLNSLLDKAADKDWAGVIVCAASKPERGVATAIVKRLLEIGDWHSELLALRCHLLKKYFDDALEPRVQELTHWLFPPNHIGQAEAIAALGNAAVERLKFREDLLDNQSIASVQALGFINTTAARTAAETYVNDERVFDQLVRVINPLLIPQVLTRLQMTDFEPERTRMAQANHECATAEATPGLDGS